jgi:hypothetical protein
MSSLSSVLSAEANCLMTDPGVSAVGISVSPESGESRFQCTEGRRAQLEKAPIAEFCSARTLEGAVHD